MKSVGIPTTVGELRALLAALPDDMPLHHRGNMGDHPCGLMLVIRKLAPAKSDRAYFADVETDPLWSKPKYRKTFASAIDTLCTV